MLMTGVIMLCSACFSVKISTTGASIPSGARTVSVQYFENRAAYVEAALAQQMTDALKDYIQGNSSLIMVSGSGDLDFEGTILAYDTKPTAVVSGDLASKNRFTITVRIRYTCSVDPDQSFEQSFSRYQDYDSSQDFENVKAALTEDIQKLLIEDIYNKAFVNW